MAHQKFNIKVKPQNTETTQPTSNPFNSINSAADSLSEPAAETKPTPPKRVSIIKEKNEQPNDSKYVPRSKIVFNKENKYNQKKIEELAESILYYGLIHNPEGYYDEENDVYVLEAGERRTRAIDLLLEKYLNAEETDTYEYQCFLKNVKRYEHGIRLSIKRPEVDENGELTELEQINSLLRIEEANLQVRDEDPLERAQALQRRKELLQRKNKLIDKKFRINITQKLAEERGMGKSTVKKYTAIAEKLIPELQEEFRKNNITLNEGAKFAQLSETEQQYILQMVRNGEKASQKEIEKLRELTQQQKEATAQKEAELQKLQTEKAAAEKKLATSLENLEEERARIEKQIRDEIELDNEANEATIAKLKKDLEKKEKQLLESQNALQEHIRARDTSMEVLQKQIKELKEKPAVDPNEQKILRLNIAYDAAISNLKSAVESAFSSYQTLIAFAPEREEELKKLFTETVNKF